MFINEVHIYFLERRFSYSTLQNTLIKLIIQKSRQVRARFGTADMGKRDCHLFTMMHKIIFPKFTPSDFFINYIVLEG